MGIKGLWSLLEPIKEEVCKTECKGKKIAVDLSSWIVECSTVSLRSSSPCKSTPSKSFLINRGIFFKAINLSKLGIILVFVLDGPEAPPRKGKVNRHEFYRETLQYKDLLTAMGFMVLEAKGEAEKMCAELNQRNIVDGVCTSDGDAIVYGAKVVYKGMFKEENKNINDQHILKYTMTNVKEKLHLSQKDLVAFALLSKGDISDGVKSVGVKTFLELCKEFYEKGVTDSLERIKSWKYNEELNCIEQQNDQKPEKGTHCTNCAHEGRRLNHTKSGCPVCKTEAGCEDRVLAPAIQPCPCPCCGMERSVRPHLKELKIRRLALDEDQNFPPLDIIEEFLVPCNTLPEGTEVCMRQPNFRAVYKLVQSRLNFDQLKTVEYLIPWTIEMAFNGILPGITPKPLKIVKRCKKKSEDCYTVKWEQLDFDDLSDDTNHFYEVTIAKDLFAIKHPEITEEFEKPVPTKKKVTGKKKLDENQPEILDFFKHVKKQKMK